MNTTAAATQARRLKAAIAEQGTTCKALAEGIGISPSTFYRKANRKSEFTAQEISSICARLSLSREQLKSIFFSD